MLRIVTRRLDDPTDSVRRVWRVLDPADGMFLEPLREDGTRNGQKEEGFAKRSPCAAEGNPRTRSPSPVSTPPG